MRRMLVTGAAGFIGANFVRYWLDTYPDDIIVVVDALTYAGNRANLAGVLSAGRMRYQQYGDHQATAARAPADDGSPLCG